MRGRCWHKELVLVGAIMTRPERDSDNPMNPSRLAALEGTASSSHWSFRGNEGNPATRGGRAILPLFCRKSSNEYELVGTGFYVDPNGMLVTAAHVAEKLIDDCRGGAVATTIHILGDGRYLQRRVNQFHLHSSSDIAVGLPEEIIENKSGLPVRCEYLTMKTSLPEIGSPVATWSYPLHRITSMPDGGTEIELDPTFYDGIYLKYFAKGGPSVKLNPPYCLTNIHLHGASSGGPIFDTTGNVVGIASSSYDGQTDVSYFTPIMPIMEIEIAVSFVRGEEPKRMLFYELAARQVLFK